MKRYKQYIMCLLHDDPEMFIFQKLYWVVHEMIHQFYAFHNVSSVTAFVYHISILA